MNLSIGFNVSGASRNGSADNSWQGAKKISLEEFSKTYDRGISQEQIDKSYPYLRPEIDQSIKDGTLVVVDLGESERRGDGSYEKKSRMVVMTRESYNKHYRRDISEVNQINDAAWNDMVGAINREEKGKT